MFNKVVVTLICMVVLVGCAVPPESRGTAFPDTTTRTYLNKDGSSVTFNRNGDVVNRTISTRSIFDKR